MVNCSKIVPTVFQWFQSRSNVSFKTFQISGQNMLRWSQQKKMASRMVHKDSRFGSQTVMIVTTVEDGSKVDSKGFQNWSKSWFKSLPKLFQCRFQQLPNWIPKMVTTTKMAPIRSVAMDFKIGGELFQNCSNSIPIPNSVPKKV